MLVSEIITAVQGLANVSKGYDALWIPWINACLDDLSQVAYNPSRKTIAMVNATTEYTIPSGIQEIFGLTYKPAAGAEYSLTQISPLDVFSKGWKLQDKIILQGLTAVTGDTVNVHCYATFNYVVQNSDTPALWPQYHEMIVLYLASRSQQKEEELEERVDFYQEYLKRRQEFAEIRLRQAEAWRKTVRSAQK